MILSEDEQDEILCALISAVATAKNYFTLKAELSRLEDDAPHRDAMVRFETVMNDALIRARKAIGEDAAREQTL